MPRRRFFGGEAGEGSSRSSGVDGLAKGEHRTSSKAAGDGDRRLCCLETSSPAPEDERDTLFKAPSSPRNLVHCAKASRRPLSKDARATSIASVLADPLQAASKASRRRCMPCASTRRPAASRSQAWTLPQLSCEDTSRAMGVDAATGAAAMGLVVVKAATDGVGRASSTQASTPSCTSAALS
jgi:hypothetical protein